MLSRHSPNSLRILRLGAFHFVLNFLLMILCAGVLLWSMVDRSYNTFSLALILSLFWLASVGLFYFLFRASTCPECLSRIWIKKGSGKHPLVGRFLGLSSRLGVAVSVLLGRRFLCPDCGRLVNPHTKRR